VESLVILDIPPEVGLCEVLQEIAHFDTKRKNRPLVWRNVSKDRRVVDIR
jgi:hypothetical protein